MYLYKIDLFLKNKTNNLNIESELVIIVPYVKYNITKIKKGDT